MYVLCYVCMYTVMYYCTYVRMYVSVSALLCCVSVVGLHMYVCLSSVHIMTLLSATLCCVFDLSSSPPSSGVVHAESTV